MCVRANTEQDGAFIFMDEVKNILYIIKHAILIVKMNDKLLFFFLVEPLSPSDSTHTNKLLYIVPHRHLQLDTLISPSKPRIPFLYEQKSYEFIMSKCSLTMTEN
jgi:hypothetical protein